jgi:hypothetical protein
MVKNQYYLCNKKERDEFFHEVLAKKVADINFEEFEDSICFLCSQGLSSEWLTPYSLSADKLMFPSNLRTETNVVYHVSINQLIELGRCLKVHPQDQIDRYIRRLNSISFERVSVASEILLISKYIMRNYNVRYEPPNKRIGRSGLEGKSDLAVKFKNKWIYFEVTQESSHPISVMGIKLGEIAYTILEQIKEKRLVPDRMRIDGTIINMNKVLSKNWSSKYLDHLRRISIKLNSSHNFEGINYKILTRLPNEPVFLFGTPITNTKLKFNAKMKSELRQIPKNKYGVIIINCSWNFGYSNYVYYARELLNKEGFRKILAIIIWDQFQDVTHRIVHRNNLSIDLLNFLEIPFN